MNRWTHRPTNLAAALLLVGGTSFLAWAQVTGSDERTLPYRGHIDLDGQPVTGNADLTFSLYDAEADGTLLWGPETHPGVPLSGGDFAVALGFTDAIPLAVLRTTTLFASITINGTALAGRQRIMTSFSALRAGSLEMTDPETGGRFRLTADEGPGTASPGVTLVAVDDPPANQPIFRVVSSGGAERLRVEHDGLTAVQNDFYVDGLSTLDGDTTVAGNLTVTGSMTGRIVGGGESSCTLNGATYRGCRAQWGSFSCTGGGCGGQCAAGSTLRTMGQSNLCYTAADGWNASCYNYLCIQD